MTQQLENIHLFSKNGEYASFDKETYSLMTLSKLTYQVIDFLQSGMSVLEVSKETGVTVGDIINLISRLNSKRILSSTKKSECEKAIINRITLHISNDCNLRCKYCYASGGNYKQKRGLMTEQTARQFIIFVWKHLRRLKILFFSVVSHS